MLRQKRTTVGLLTCARSASSLTGRLAKSRARSKLMRDEWNACGYCNFVSRTRLNRVGALWRAIRRASRRVCSQKPRELLNVTKLLEFRNGEDLRIHRNPIMHGMNQRQAENGSRKRTRGKAGFAGARRLNGRRR